jgi:glycosyltransferase involved in cell wall biosynthesis
MRKIKKIALMAVGDSAWQGGIQYGTNILNALNTVSSQGQLEIHLFKRKHQHFLNLQDFTNLNLQVHLVEEEFPGFTFLNRVYWFLQRKLFGRINPQAENYFLSNGFDYVFPATLSSCNGRLNSGSWIADFQYHHFPDGHDRKINIQAERTIGFIAHKTDKIIFSSKFCQNDGFTLFPVVQGKSEVMPFTVYINPAHLQDDHLPAVRERYGIEGPYIMVSNVFGATKNHKTLFEALGLLRKKGLRINCVCTGNFVNYAMMEFTNEVFQMITRAGIRDQLFILGLIPREDQIALYRMSLAMVQPSINEGWSTCVEEAKALGKTLILSDIEVHREQYPENPHFFKGTDPQELSVQLEKVFEMNSGREFPDRLVEQDALKKYHKEVISFGENFIRIASL